MDREKDIGPIYNLYSSKSENINDDKISDIENSINASLINHKETNICQNKNLYNYFVLVIFLVSVSILVCMVYLYII